MVYKKYWFYPVNSLFRSRENNSWFVVVAIERERERRATKNTTNLFRSHLALHQQLIDWVNYLLRLPEHARVKREFKLERYMMMKRERQRQTQTQREIDRESECSLLINNAKLTKLWRTQAKRPQWKLLFFMLLLWCSLAKWKQRWPSEFCSF